MALPEEELRIDDYFRKRLMPVDSAIPQLGGIEMYGNSIPAGSVGGDLFACSSTLTFNNVTTLTLGSHAPSAFPRITWSPFPAVNPRETW